MQRRAGRTDGVEFHHELWVSPFDAFSPGARERRGASQEAGIVAESMDVLRLSSRASAEFGRARIEPRNSVVAGSYGTWRLAVTVGGRGIASGGAIKIDTDSDSDWGWPQVEDPSAPEYLTLTVPDEAEVALRLRDHLSLLLLVTGRPLAPGEQIVLTYGDRRGGGPGSRAQTFREDRRRFWVEVDADGTGSFTPLTDPPELRIVGGAVSRLVVVAPSTVVVGEPFGLLVKAEDAWGNPAPGYRGHVTLEATGLLIPGGALSFARSGGGVCVVEKCRALEPGVHRIAAVDEEAALRAQSNPLVASRQRPAHRLYWGDPHGGQVVDPQKIDDFFRYARDVAGIQFVGFQRNDHVMSNEAYALQQRSEREHCEPGRFVPLPGYEWSGEREVGGHHNVYFRRFDQPIRRSDHRGTLDRSDQDTDLCHVLDLHRAYRHADVVIVPHVGGVHADLTYHEPALEPVAEVTSTHGSFEWFLRETLERRYTLGFVGGSDSYTGRPGDDRPGHQLRRYAKSGLTGVYATALTLEALLDALKARRCYATTGARIVAALLSDGHPMGAEYRTDAPPEIGVSIWGTAPLEQVEVYRGLDLVYRHDLGLRTSPNRIRILWEGASRKSSYSGVVWEGRVRVEGGRISGVTTLRFDSPRSHVSSPAADELRWHSWTCGYVSGLAFDLEGGPDARIEVLVSSSTITGARYGGHGEGTPQRMSFAPADRVRLALTRADLLQRPRVIELGVLNRKIRVGLADEPGPERVEFSFRDPSPAPGINPYWVKVIQADMEMAWTSPVFVDYAPPPARGHESPR